MAGFLVELVKQLWLDPDRHYKPLLNGEKGSDSKIKEFERKEIVLRNLDSLLEHEDFDRADTSCETEDKFGGHREFINIHHLRIFLR